MKQRASRRPGDTHRRGRQRTVAAPQRQATVMMVTDVSGSMRATDVEPDRLSAAVEAGHALADKLPDKLRLGLVSFSDYAEQTVQPTTERQPVEDALDRLVADGGTALDPTIVSQLLSKRRATGPLDDITARERAVLELMAEGRNNRGIADVLVVTPAAVEKHVTAILRKLEIEPVSSEHRRVHAVLAYLQNTRN